MTVDAEVLAQILSKPALQSVSFTVGPTRVSAGDYRFIADALRMGAITVEPMPEGHEGVGAFYSYEGARTWAIADAFYLRSDFNPSSPRHQALFFHEATHALQDRARLRMTRMDAEVAAHAAQGCFYLALGLAWPDHATPTAATRPILEAGWAAAQAVWRARDRALVASAVEYAALAAALAGHPQYETAASDAFQGDGFGHEHG
jgi:hypothetical protein